MLLGEDDKKLFEDFIKHRESTSSRSAIHIGDEEKALSYLILFGEVYPNASWRQRYDYCPKDDCRRCPAFTSKRCLAFVRRHYEDERVNKILKKSPYDHRIADYKFWQEAKTALRASRYLTQCKIVGEYRVKLFQQFLHNKARQCVENYNQWKSDAKKIDEIEEKNFLPSYCTTEYIENHDKWLQFRAIQEEEDFLCSVLSGF